MTASLEGLAFAIEPARRRHLERARAEREARRWMDGGASVVYGGERPRPGDPPEALLGAQFEAFHRATKG